MSTANEETSYSIEDIQKIMAPALEEKHSRVRGFFDRLKHDPPQVILLEGGTADEREGAALYWACLLNCTAETKPCLACTACAQMITRNNRDMHFLDGRQGSIKIEQIREIRGVLGEPPRGNGTRMVILSEAQSLGIEAANALLKSLEEPRPGTSFLLLTPQRERLLPTLVSRSWVLTLAWPVHTNASAASDTVLDWAQSLATFMQDGTGWFDRTASKGSLNTTLAQEIIVHCQRELACAITGTMSGALATHFAKLPMPYQRKLDEALAECQESLVANVNPALVMDWLATRLAIMKGQR